MVRLTTEGDALLEILELCEQTLAAIRPREEGLAQRPASDKSSQSSRRMRANVARHLILIQGGSTANLQQHNVR